ncbi:MAG: hypothetical protein JWM56_1370 [Candidatus Peribacteria bacterium]|nr:hypothetical protein [Candidatus Peribacteria bacterium]
MRFALVNRWHGSALIRSQDASPSDIVKMRLELPEKVGTDPFAAFVLTNLFKTIRDKKPVDASVLDSPLLDPDLREAMHSILNSPPFETL